MLVIFSLSHLVTHVQGSEEDRPRSEEVQHRHCLVILVLDRLGAKVDLAHVGQVEQVVRHLLLVLPGRPPDDLLGLLGAAPGHQPPHGLGHGPVGGQQQQQGQVGQHLEAAPVPHQHSLHAEHGLAQREGDLDGDADQHGELVADMLHRQHEAHHEAADAAHPRQEPQETEPVVAPFSATESSEMKEII